MSEAQQAELMPPEKKNGKLAKRERAIVPQQPATPMGLIEMAVKNGAGIEVIERLKALYDQERSKAEEAEFNAAMNRVQAAIERIAPNMDNAQTNSRYASYAAIDKHIRPIYSKEGFSLSFNTEPSTPEHVKVVCFVSHCGGHTRRYEVDMPADGKGPKGGDVMTKTHATGAAMQYGQRYLAKFVFNLAIGPDDDGNAASADLPGIESMLKAISEAPDLSAARKEFGEAYRKSKLAKNAAAELKIIATYDKRKAELTATEAA